MIELTDINGRKRFLAAKAIAQVSEPGPSAAWHGVRAFVKTFDGETLEVQQTPEMIAAALAKAEGRSND